MADLKAQLEISADATGVEAGVSRAKKSIASLGQSAVAAGKEASQAVSGIGDGAAPAVAKVDAATRNIIGSIQRQIATLEAGSRAGSKYFESIASQRGANLDVLRPLLTQLDAVAAKQKNTADGFARLGEQGRAALDRIRQGDRLTEGLSRAGIGAAAAAELRALDAVKERQKTIADGFARLGEQGRASLDKLVIGQRLTAGLTQAGRETQAASAALATAGRAGSAALNQYGLSAKQTAAALRQVPAQITDIFTSLQGGQAPLTVLLQQGGQLRDVFGGVQPALSALGSAVLGLINPFTVAGAAAGALGLAYFQGSREADEFAKSLILTGNAAGATVGQLNQIAAAISGVVGTQGKAAGVLAQLAGSGQVTRDNLERVATAVIKLEREAGKSIDKTVQEFAELGKEPVKASERLNEKYNYLTLSVYEQIRALQEQGRATDAAALAQRTFADASIERADRLADRLGFLQQAWRLASDEAKAFWNAALNVGRAETPEERLATLEARLSSIASAPDLGPEFGGDSGATRAALEAEIATLRGVTKASAEAADAEAERAQVQKAGIAASKEIERIREASRTNQQKLNAELKGYRDNLDAIRKADPNSILLDPARIKADEQAIRARFKTAAPAARDDAANRMLQSLREAESVSRAQLSVDKELTASEQKKAEFVQLIADLKDKRVLTADQKSLRAAQDAIKAQLDKNIAVEREVKARADATKELEKQQRELEAFQDRAAQLAQSIRTANANRADQNADRLSAFGRGDEAREQLQAQIAIQREFQRYQEQLDKATPKNLLGSDLYRAETARIRDELAAALALNRQYYADLAVAQADWANGATRAFENYLADARDVAGQVENLLGNAFSGLEDALVEFTTTGKLSFSGLAASIVEDINRIIIKQALIKPIEDLLTGTQNGEGLGGLLAKGLGGLFGGNATGSPGAQAKTAAGGAGLAEELFKGSAAVALAQTEAALAIGTASASSSLALGALTTAAGAASQALALVAANSGGGGDDILGTFINALGVSGGRANGGPVSAGGVYRINERGAPEIATFGGKDYLLAGATGGKVSSRSDASASNLALTINQSFAAGTDRRTIDQAASSAARELQRVIAELG
jgi:lambda family phage tail tape measure protein